VVFGKSDIDGLWVAAIGFGLIFGSFVYSSLRLCVEKTALLRFKYDGGTFNAMETDNELSATIVKHLARSVEYQPIKDAPTRTASRSQSAAELPHKYPPPRANRRRAGDNFRIFFEP